MTARHLILMLTLCALAAGCDSRAVPTAPTAPVPSPAPLAPNPPPGLSWTGTLVSSNWSFTPMPIQARLQRTGNMVKGDWFEVLWLDFGGTIDGTIDGTAFVGTLTIIGATTIEACKAAVQGTFTDTTASWTIPAMNDGCSVYSFPSPVDITIELSLVYMLSPTARDGH